MHKYLVLGLLILVGCTQNPQEQSPIELSKELELKSGQLVGSADFGTLTLGQNKVMTLKIKNNGDENITGPATMSGTDFSIIYQSGCTLLKVGGLCTLKINFDSRGKAPGNYLENIQLDSVLIPVSAEIEAPVQISAVNFSPSSINYGSVTVNDKISKSLTVKNTGNTVLNSQVQVSSDFSILYDSCSGKNIAPSKTCSVKVYFSGEGKSGLISGNLDYASSSVALSAEVLVPVITEQLTVNPSSLSDIIYTEGESSKIITFALSNLGNVSLTPQVRWLNNQNLVNAQIIYNQCQTELLPNKSCIIKINLPAPNNNTNLSQTLEFAKDAGVALVSIPMNLKGAIVVNQLLTLISGKGTVLGTPTEGSFSPCISSSNCVNTLPENTQVTLSVQPAPGYFFEGWGADCQGEENTSCVVSLSNDKTIEAYFSQKFNRTYSKGANDQVRKVNVLPNNKILISGNFSQYDGINKNRLVMLNNDGSIDSSFNSPGLGSDAIAVARQSDGKLLLSGYFSKNIMRLNADGSNDASFPLGSGFNSTVYGIEVQSDGKIIVGGEFSSYNGVAVSKIARLNTDGTLDTSFNPGTGPNDRIDALIVDGNKYVIVGQFTSYNGVSSNRIAKINADGTLDSSFNIGSGFNLGASVIKKYGTKYVVSGGFTQYNGLSYQRIIMINSDGSVDSSFAPGSLLNTPARDMVITADNKIIIVGFFSSYLMRINSNGTKDTSLLLGAGFNNTALAVDVDSSGNLIIGGEFTAYRNLSKGRILRLLPNGDPDPNSFTVSSAFSGIANAVSIDNNDRITVAGNFTNYNNNASNRIARLLPSGAYDSSFVVGSGFNSGVQSISPVSDGLMVGGVFSSYNGVGRSSLAKILPNGSVDLNFVPATISASGGASVYSVSELIDGYIIGGGFTSVGGNSRNYIAKLNLNGTLNSSFNVGTGFNGFVEHISVDANNKIVVTGAFSSYQGVPVSRIVRLNQDGSIDTSFNSGSGFNDRVYKVLHLINNQMLMVGDFSNYNGTSVGRIIRLNYDGSVDNTFNSNGANSGIRTIVATDNGKYYLGGDFSNYQGSSRNRLVRINADGSLDSSLLIGSGFNSLVKGIVELSDNKIVVVGDFLSYNGILADYIIKLNPDGSESNE